MSGQCASLLGLSRCQRDSGHEGACETFARFEQARPDVECQRCQRRVAQPETTDWLLELPENVWTCPDCRASATFCEGFPGCAFCSEGQVSSRLKEAKTFDELVALTYELPRMMTEEQRISQAIEWGWALVAGPEYESPRTKAIFAGAAWRREFVKMAAGLESYRCEGQVQRKTISELRTTIAEYRELHYKEGAEIETLRKALNELRDEVSGSQLCRR